MTKVFWCYPLRWPRGIGFHKPIPGAMRSSSRRASSPRLDQGGSIEALIEGIWRTAEMNRSPSTPQSRFDVVVSLRRWLRGPDRPRPKVVHSLTLAATLGPAGRCPLGTRGLRTCLRHPLRPPLGGGGRLTPTTLGARLSSLTSFLRALEVGGFAAMNPISGRRVAGRAERPASGFPEASEVPCT